MMPPAGEPLPDAEATDELVAYPRRRSSTRRRRESEPRPQIAASLEPHRVRQRDPRPARARDQRRARCLPNDSEAYGFDNIADVLGTDPSLMDRYLSAAWKVTSAAIGDTDIAPAVSTYRVPPDRSQTDHVEGLPLGTRGGMLVSHHFPVDGEYVIRPRLWRNTVDVVRGTETPHDLEVSLDGERLSLTRFGGPDDEVPAQMFPGKTADEIDARFETRRDRGGRPARRRRHVREEELGDAPRRAAAVRAREARRAHGRRHSRARPDRHRRAARRSRARATRRAARGSSRVTRTSARAKTRRAPTEILSTLARRAYRRPITDAERDRLVGLYDAERAKGRDFEAGVQTGLAYVLVAPQFLFRVEQDPAGAAPGTCIGSATSSSRRGCRSSCGAACPTTSSSRPRSPASLSEPAELAQQVERMLADERATTLAKSFASQWLYLRNLRASAPDMYAFPDFDDNLRQSAIRETELLFETIVREDRPLTELLSADYTYLERAARAPLRRARHLRRPVPARRRSPTRAATACSAKPAS